MVHAHSLLSQIAKILRYLGQESVCNITFGVFVITWFIARHIMYLQLCYDIYMDVPGPNTMLYGCYSSKTNELLTDIPARPDKFFHLLWPFEDVDGAICLNVEVKFIFLGMLGLLQVLSVIWFGMILKIIVGMLMGGKAEDTRSDDEEDVDEEINNEHGQEKKQKRMDVTDLNVCVGGAVAADMEKGPMMLSPRPRPTSTRRRLMAAENRKELLGRIGCEKP
jgi:very-long-chain ceramide synthase